MNSDDGIGFIHKRPTTKHYKYLRLEGIEVKTTLRELQRAVQANMAKGEGERTRGKKGITKDPSIYALVFCERVESSSYDKKKRSAPPYDNILQHSLIFGACPFVANRANQPATQPTNQPHNLPTSHTAYQPTSQPSTCRYIIQPTN